MKAQREHVVLLSKPTIRIIKRCREPRTRDCPLIFAGMKGYKPLSDMTLTTLLREMKQTYPAQGFRSASRDIPISFMPSRAKSR